jgi:hypothetical protein
MHYRNPNDDNLRSAAEAAGATLRSLEEQFADAYKQQPAIKRASANIDKAKGRGSQSTTTRAGGAAAPAMDATALLTQARQEFTQRGLDPNKHYPKVYQRFLELQHQATQQR